MADERTLIDRELKRRQKQASMIDDELSLRAIDFEGGDKQSIRAAISDLPKRLKTPALRRWADREVSRQRKSESETTLGSIAQGVDDTVRNLARGTVVGPFLDEFSAYVNSGFDSDSPEYDETLEFQRAKDRAVDRETGLVGGATKLVGGVSEAVAAPIGLALRGGSFLGNVARGSAIGAGHGAAAGFGSGEGGGQNRLRSAATGAQVGAALGGALPVVAGAVAPAVGAVANRVRPAIAPFTSGPQRAADLSIAKRVSDVGGGDLRQGVNALVGDINAGQRAQRFGSNSVAQLPETLADRSNGLQRLAGTIYRQGGRPAEVVSETMTRRQRGPDNLYDLGSGAQTTQLGQRGQAKDMFDAFERALRVKTSDTPTQTIRRLKQEASDEGRAFYKQAFDNQQPFSIVDELTAALNRYQEFGANPIANRMRKAVGYFAPKPQKTMLNGAPPQTNGARRPVSTLQEFDNAKRAIDDDISAAVRKGNNNLARELTDLKATLVAKIDETNPDYAVARQAWGSKAQQQEAVDLGRKAFEKDSEVTVDAYNALSPPNQRLFRVGMLDGMRQLTRTANPGTDVSRIFEQQRVVELMREAIPNSKKIDSTFVNRSGQFGDFVSRQGRMVQTRNTVMGGSPTARNQLDDNAEAVRTLSQVWDQFRQTPSITRMLMDGIGVLGNRYLGFREDVALQIARRLVQMNPQAQIRFLQTLEERVGPDPMIGFVNGLQDLTQAAVREGAKLSGRNLAVEEE